MFKQKSCCCASHPILWTMSFIFAAAVHALNKRISLWKALGIPAEHKAAAREKHCLHFMTWKKQNRTQSNNAYDQLGQLATGSLFLGMNLDLNSLNMNVYHERFKFTSFVLTKHKRRPSADLHLKETFVHVINLSGRYLPKRLTAPWQRIDWIMALSLKQFFKCHESKR